MIEGLSREILVILEPSVSIKFITIGDLDEHKHKHKCNHRKYI